jgi:hypothetical protein
MMPVPTTRLLRRRRAFSVVAVRVARTRVARAVRVARVARAVIRPLRVKSIPKARIQQIMQRESG